MNLTKEAFERIDRVLQVGHLFLSSSGPPLLVDKRQICLRQVNEASLDLPTNLTRVYTFTQKITFLCR